MTTVITRQRFSNLGDKMADDDKCDSYADMISDRDVAMELNTISEGSSGSSIAEMNNNTNGKVLVSGPQVNINDNRQQLLQAPTIQAPTVPGPNSTTLMKKIKQIYMDEVPLHLSGLSISGSGMELFVKLDANLDKALRQANRTVNTRQGKKRKRMTRTKKLKNYLHTVNPTSERGKTAPQSGLDPGSPREEAGKQANDHLAGGLKTMTIKNNEPLAAITGVKGLDAIATESKPSVTDRIHQMKVAPQDMKSYFPKGWGQGFQRERQTPTPNLPTNMIRGPTWNVDNGQIDVIRSLDTLPSASNVQLDMPSKDNTDYDSPVDYSMNPFPRGFESNNLPLKRQMSPPRWQIHHMRHDAQQAFENLYGNDNLCASNGYTRREGIKRVKAGKVRKLPPKRTTALVAIPVPSTSQEESIAAAERCFSGNKDVKRSLSNVSNGQQSSIGPQFQTDLLTPQTMDAETLIKFTEYTHDLRKDLKQKYKDLSKLLKAFEETVQHKNNTEEENEEEDAETEPPVGRCSIM